MDPAFINRLAEDYGIPALALEGVAATVAARCALIANRYVGPEPEHVSGATSAVPVGPQIGAAILAEFEP